MQSLNWLEWVGVICGILLGISEALPFSDKIKSNGILQAITQILGFGKKLGQKDPQ